MITQIRPSTWVAFTGLFLAGVGGMISTITTPLKAHYPDLLAHLEGGPVWSAFGQDVTANNIYWGYAYSGPLAIIIWALVVILAIRAAPSIQESKLFLGMNIIGTTALLIFVVAHLLLVGQILVGISLIGFLLVFMQNWQANRTA